MADSTLTALPAASALAGADLFYAVQSGTDVKVTATQIQTFTGGGSNTYTATFSGNVSAAAWTTTGIGLVGAAASFTDTSSSGTVATMYVHRLGVPTVLASSSTTYTAAFGLWVEPPTASTNVTISNKFATGFNGNLGLNFPANTTSGRRCWVLEGDGNTAIKFRRWSDNFGAAAASVWTVDNSITTETFNLDAGSFNLTSATTFMGFANDTYLSRPAAATLQQGKADAAAPVAQTLRVQSVVAGTTDTAGTDWTRRASLSTGTAAGGNIVEQTGFSAKTTGTGQGTAVDRNTIISKGKALTSTAAFSMFDVALPTLQMCGGQIEATIVATDGTDMQSFTQTVTYSAVNKGGVYTTSITPSTGDKSVSAGTLTTSWTVVSGANKVTIKVTPTTSLTITPGALQWFLLYYTLKNNSEQLTTIL